MQKAIDKNKFSEIKKYVATASLDDLDYANKKNNIQAAFLILQSETVALKLHARCKDKLSFDEKVFLCKGTDPRDMADLINRLK